MLKEKVMEFLNDKWYYFGEPEEDLRLVYVGRECDPKVLNILEDHFKDDVKYREVLNPTEEKFKLSDYIKFRDFNCTLIVVVDDFDNLVLEDEFFLKDWFDTSSLIFNTKGDAHYLHEYPVIPENREAFYKYAYPHYLPELQYLFYRMFDYEYYLNNSYNKDEAVNLVNKLRDCKSDVDEANFNKCCDILTEVIGEVYNLKLDAGKCRLLNPHVIKDLIDNATTVADADNIISKWRGENKLIIKDVNKYYASLYVDGKYLEDFLEILPNVDLSEAEIKDLANMFNK